MSELTFRQLEVLTAIARYRMSGSSPTIRELGEELGIGSPNGISSHLRALQRKDFVEYSANKSRSLKLTAKANALFLTDIAKLHGPKNLVLTEGTPVSQETGLFSKGDNRGFVRVQTNLFETQGVFCGDALFVVEKRIPPNEEAAGLFSEAGEFKLGKITFSNGIAYISSMGIPGQIEPRSTPEQTISVLAVIERLERTFLS